MIALSSAISSDRHPRLNLGKPDLLFKSLAQSSPKTPRVFITNETDVDVDADVVFEGDVNAGTVALAALWDARSSWTLAQYPGHLCAAKRWFYYRNYLKQISYDTASPMATFDTDVMVFTDVKAWWYDYPERHDLVATGTPSRYGDEVIPVQAPTFIRNLDVLNEFCAFVMWLLGDEKHLKALTLPDYYHGRVGDMTLWWAFLTSKGIPFKRITDIDGGSTWDHMLSLDYHGYEHNGHAKVMQFRHGVPWCYNREKRQWIRFNSLHFSGQEKGLMPGAWNDVQGQLFNPGGRAFVKGGSAGLRLAAHIPYPAQRVTDTTALFDTAYGTKLLEFENYNACPNPQGR